MKFTKMHGIGNDYVYVNCFEEEVADPARTARFVSDRHFGIGSDGLILIRPNPEADCEMDMYNLDGSRGKMCGNGIRCVAKYAYDHGICRKEEMTIATGSGLRTVKLTVRDGKAVSVRVDMGEPILEPEKIPARRELFESSGEGPLISAPLKVGEETWAVTCVSMGNPHSVVFVPSVADFPLEKTGPLFEVHPAFPEQVNAEFVELIDENTVRMRVWERGSAETMACGTGACAVAVASILNHKVKGPAVTVKLLGGDLSILWDQESGHVFMDGPATEVFSGVITLPWEG